MSSNETNKNCVIYPEFKFPLSRSLNNSLIEQVPSHTPQKDLFLHLKPQMNTSNISPNKYSFDPKLFINDYNSGNKNSNSEFAQEKMNINSLLFFNSTKKEKKFIGKKRRFKYILSSEKKIKEIKNNNPKNKFINIKQICLHGHHLLNFNLFQNNNEYITKAISFPNKLIKLLTKKFHYFNLCYSDNSINNPKREYNIPKIKLTSDELKQNNLDYFQGETNSDKILQKYCEEIENTLEKIKNNYLTKKKFVYITKNVLLLELLIRNCNLFTNYLMKKFPQCDINTRDDSPLGKIIMFSTKQSLPSLPLANKKFLENLAENHTTTTKKGNLIGTENNMLINKHRTTLFKSNIPSENAYKCDFCQRVFKNGQALGGHISQSHPKQSYKYRQKIEIRNSRTERRELLYEARKRLFRSYNIDLDYMIKNKRKNEIKKFIKNHKVEYKKELIALKNCSNMNNGSVLNNKEMKDKNNLEGNDSDSSNNFDIDINASSK